MKNVREFMRAHRRLTGERRVQQWVEARGWCFSQGDQSIANQAGAAFRADLNTELQALVSLSSGAAAPGTTYARQLWADTTSNLLKRRNAANSAWLAVSTLDETFALARSSNTILGVSDFGKLIKATSTFTQTLTAAATLGDGWYVDYRNDGTGVITLDPNSTETIDGATTLDLYPSETCRIWCDGSNFKTVGLGKNSIKVGNFTRDISTASGTQAITGVGFKPSAVIIIGGVNGTSRMSVGIDDATNVGNIGDDWVDLADSYVATSTQSIFQASSAAANSTAKITALGADGFTLTWTKTGAPVGTAIFTYIAFR